MTKTDSHDETDVDAQAAEAFAGRLFELFTGAALSALVDVGRRTSLFDAAAIGPATSSEIAERAGLHERYVREWLSAMATAGIVEYDAPAGRFWLPREHSLSLTGERPENLSGLALLTTILANHVVGVTDAFRHGGGVPYDAFVPDIHDALDALWGPIYTQLLVPEYVPLVPGLTDQLAAGVRVADVACGTGRALVALAEAFPQSTFVGFDLDQAALDRARVSAAERRLDNVTFRWADAAELDAVQSFDVVFVFNAIHDQANPEAALACIHNALVPGGIFVMDEPRLSSRLEENLDNPLAPFTYAVSTLHCLTVSLAANGAGLGAAWGEQLAVEMLRRAGFDVIAVHAAPGDPGNALFVTTRPNHPVTHGER